MKIEHIICVSAEEYRTLIAESNSHNPVELKKYLKEKLNMQTDFCVKVIEDAYELCPIGYEGGIFYEKFICSV